MRIALLSAATLLALLAGCSGSMPTQPATPPPPEHEPEAFAAMTVEPGRLHHGALDAFAEHDRKSDWSADACASIAGQFLAANERAAREGRALPEAVYNAGLAHQRCSNDAEAKKYFERTLALDPKSHRAKTQLALYAYKEGGDGALESTIKSLEQAVLDAQFQNTEALVNLAMLQMKRGSGQGGTGCSNDLDCAKKNIQRALAVDDAFMPAFNQLAIYYLERAKEKADSGKAPVITTGLRKGKKLDAQQLELAALVCSQAIRKNPKYAAIHNTAGLIQVELGNINSAVQEFKAAADLDPRFFEAQMNYAAVNLSFRGFKAAEDAYRAALKIKDKDYDAHLGLALAIRGQINDANFDANIKAAQEVLDKARQIAPDRPETYYNEAILTQEFKVRTVTDPKEQIPVFKQAIVLYEKFIDKAGTAGAYAETVRQARERIDDINSIFQFINGA